MVPRSRPFGPGRSGHAARSCLPALGPSGRAARATLLAHACPLSALRAGPLRPRCLLMLARSRPFGPGRSGHAARSWHCFGALVDGHRLDVVTRRAAPPALHAVDALLEDFLVLHGEIPADAEVVERTRAPRRHDVEAREVAAPVAAVPHGHPTAPTGAPADLMRRSFRRSVRAERVFDTLSRPCRNGSRTSNPQGSAR